MRPSTSRTLIVAAAVATIGIVPASPSAAAPATDAPAEPAAPADPEPPAETSPPAVDPEVPDSPETGGPADGDDGDGSDFLLWLAVAGLAVVAIAAIGGLVSSSNRRSRSRSAQHSSRANEVNHIVRSANWVHDQSITMLQIEDRAQLRSAWDQMRNQILGIEREVATLSARPEMLAVSTTTSAVAGALGDVRGSLEAFVSVAVSGSDRALLDNAIETVQVRRRQLVVAVSDLAASAR